jgi:macrolide-specific efflux system membrane fusion protein
VIGHLDIEKATLEKRQAEIEHLAAQKQADSDINVRFAEASYDVAQAHHGRAVEANEQVKGSVAASEVAERLLAAKKAKLQIEQAKLDLDVAVATAKAKGGLVDLAEVNVRRRTIAAPTAGMVVEIKKRKGEWLNPGDPLVRVIPMSRLRVEGFLDADHHGSELTGQSVTVDATLPGGKHEKFTGKVVFVSPEVEPVTNHIRIWAEVENPNLHLRPGARVSMVIDEPLKAAAK